MKAQYQRKRLIGGDDEYEDVAPTVESMKEEVEECIETLKEGKDLYKDSYGNGVDSKIYYVVQNIVTNQGMQIASVDISSDGEDIMVGVSEEKVIKILVEETNLKSLIKVTK